MGTRTKFISLTRALVRREGLRIRSGSAATFLERLAELDLPRPLHREIAPLLRELAHLNTEIHKANEALRRHVRQNVTVERLCSAPGVGPVTATSFVATLDRADRFRGAHQVQAYLGLVPRENSSGEHQHKGRITKTGNRRTRALLVEAAWALLRQGRQPELMPLREWAERLAVRRGRRVAVVALARKLSGILYAMMRDGTTFDPDRWKHSQVPQGRA